MTRPAIHPVHAMLSACAALLLACAPAAAQLILDDVPEEAQGVDAPESALGARVDFSTARFLDASGELMTLERFFGDGKPVVLVMGYYRCPVVCPLIIQRLAESFNDLDYTVGDDFNALIVSFDETETPEDAAREQARYLNAYNREVTDEVRDGFRFFASPPGQAQKIADQIGYTYKRLPNGEYSHPVVVYVLSPEGVVSRMIYGFDYPAKEMKLSLLGASEGTIAKSLGDRLLQFCYVYDPNAGAHSVEAFAVMKIGAALTIVFLATLIGGLMIAERLRRPAHEIDADPSDATRRGATPPTAPKEPAGPDTPALTGPLS